MDFIKNLIKKEPDYFTRAKDMLLWNYLQYLETNDLRYFSNYHNKSNVKEPRPDILETSMTLIYGEILELTQKFEVLEKFRKTAKILKIKVKHNAVLSLVKSIEDFDAVLGEKILNEKIEALEKWGYRLNRKIELFSQIDRIKSGLKALQTEVDVLESELIKENKAEKVSFERERLSVEMGLDLKIGIDPMKDSVERWFLLLKDLEDKVEYLKKQNRRNGKSN